MSDNIKEDFNNNLSELLAFINKQKKLKLNNIAVPTWRHLKVNSFPVENFELPTIAPYTKDYISFEGGTLDKAIIQDIKTWIDKKNELYKYINMAGEFGVSKKFVDLGEKGANAGIVLKTFEYAEIKSPIRLDFTIDKENPTVVDHNIVIAEKGSKVTVVIGYGTKDIDNAFHNGVTKVFAKNSSEVTVVKIQRMNDKSVHFDSNVAFVEENAKVNWITVEIGSKINVTNYVSNLDKDNASASLHSAYLVDGDRKQDLYYTANHVGKRTESIMDIKGVVKDKAHKLFRGNIDFKKGSIKSKGVQDEEVLLLDPTIKTDSVPMLLCEEDDVEGNHAASVGQIDEDMLFYLMSRGISEKEAKKLVIEAKFNPIFDRIPVEEIREILSAELKKRLM